MAEKSTESCEVCAYLRKCLHWKWLEKMGAYHICCHRFCVVPCNCFWGLLEMGCRKQWSDQVRLFLHYCVGCFWKL